MFKRLDRSTRISIAVYGLLALAYFFYDCAGLIDRPRFLHTFKNLALFLGMIVVLFNKERIATFLEPYQKYYKPLVCIVLIGISFYLLERSYNENISGISPYFTLINLVMIAVLLCGVFFVGQQTKAPLMLFLFVCFAFGLANYFVDSFRGQCLVPSDLYAIGTAAAVAEGYTYTITADVANAYTMLAFGWLLVIFLSKATFARRRLLVNSGVGLACFLAFVLWFNNVDIEEAYECEVSPWSPGSSYKEQGYLLCFLKLTQDLEVKPPENYSPEQAEKLRDHYAQQVPENVASVSNDSSEQPCVLVVMNETFSDLSRYEFLADSYAGPQYFKSIDADVRGDTYVSVLGGGTCNSEFEFLTGSTMGVFEKSTFPFMHYDFDGVENLAAYYRSHGYETSVIHPASKANWLRGSVYPALGVDNFYDDEYMGNVEMLRMYQTDKSTYDVVLDQLRNNQNPQFIYDITIQNHGGYATGLVPEDKTIHVPVDGQAHPELDEYVSLINQSDQDLAYLITELETLDRPVILFFFGDHQPELGDWFIEAAFDKSRNELSVDEIQEMHTVPYMIWKNYDDEPTEAPGLAEAPEPAGAPEPVEAVEATTEVEASSEDIMATQTTTRTLNTSLNYLAPVLVQESGFPLSKYQRCLMGMQEYMPAINAFGYTDEDGRWHSVQEKNPPQVLGDYAIIQYDNLFNKERESS